MAIGTSSGPREDIDTAGSWVPGYSQTEVRVWSIQATPATFWG